MKTTVDLSDSLFAEVREVATQEKTTVRALIEEGLRLAIDRRRAGRSFRLRDASFAGEGLQPGLSWDRWSEIRDAAYDGRGA